MAQREYTPESLRRAKERRAKRRMQRNLFFACSFGVILLLSGVITFLIEAPGKRAAANSLAALSASRAAMETQTAPAIGPQQPTGEIAYTPADAALIALPENGRVDMSYFDDALFLGDSLTQGLQIYNNGISNAHYAAYVGAGPRQIVSGTLQNYAGETVTAKDEILAANPGKVYILLGTNMLSSLTDEALLKYYGEMLDFLMELLPANTIFYIQGMPPVTAQKAEDPNFSVTRIQALNEQYAQMAWARGWHYLDLYHALADDAGALRAELISGSDGVHLNNEGYGVWVEYLVTHAAYGAQNPYLPGSARYRAAA